MRKEPPYGHRSHLAWAAGHCVVKSLWRCVCRASRQAAAQNLSSRVIPSPDFRNSASTVSRCASDSVSGPRMLCGFGFSLFGVGIWGCYLSPHHHQGLGLGLGGSPPQHVGYRKPHPCLHPTQQNVEYFTQHKPHPCPALPLQRA